MKLNMAILLKFVTYCVSECTFNEYVFMYVVQATNFFHGLIATFDTCMKRTRMTEAQAQMQMKGLKTKTYVRKEGMCQLAKSLKITRKRTESWHKYFRMELSMAILLKFATN